MLFCVILYIKLRKTCLLRSFTRKTKYWFFNTNLMVCILYFTRVKNFGIKIALIALNNSMNIMNAQPQNKKLKPWAIALIIIGATLLVGMIGSLLGGKMKDTYIQPPLSPADWVFPLVWTINYIAIGFAAFMTFQANQNAARRRNDLIWYGIHLFFNMLWPLFFFRLNLLAFSIFWLVLNIISAIIVACRFYKSFMAAGIIIIVYIMWLFYAFYLNCGVMVLNI